MNMISSRVRMIMVAAALCCCGTVVVQAEPVGVIAQRMQSRMAEVDALKQGGKAGENNRGFLEARSALSAQETAVMNAENSDRAAVYAELARQHGLTPTQLALGFTRSRWFVTSTIIGASSLEQLKETLPATYTPISAELAAEIDAIHLRYTNPAP